MEDNTMDSEETNSITYSSRKRKIEAELPEMPLRKHICGNEANIGTFPRETSVSNSTPAASPNGNSSEVISNARASYCTMESVQKDLNRLYRDYGLNPADIYEDSLLEFVNPDGYYSLEDETERVVTEFFDLNGEGSSDYEVSSQSPLVSQDVGQGSGKKTIDKEFEEYFSMLLL